MVRSSALTDKTAILAVVILFLALKLSFMSNALWWDSAVYIGMGKYIFSDGDLGLFEDSRPVLLPIALGIMWKTGLDPVMAGKIFVLIVSIAYLVVLYLAAKAVCNRFVGFFAALMLALFPPFIAYSDIIITDILAGFLVLLSFYFVARGKTLSSGIFISLAILAKFTALLFVPLLFILVPFYCKKFKERILFFCIGFAIILLPYFIVNLVVYGNPISPLLNADSLIKSVAGNASCPAGKDFYMNNMLVGSLISVFYLAGIFYMFNKGNFRSNISVLLLSLAPLLYFSFLLHCKDMRYSLVFIPYILVFSAFGLHECCKSISGKNRKRRYILAVALLLLIILQLIVSIKILNKDYGWLNSNDYNHDFYEFLGSEKVTGKVWSSDPFPSAFHDIRIDEKIYYPVFDEEKINLLLAKIDDGIQFVFVNACEIPCIQPESSCEWNKKAMIGDIKSRFYIYKQATINGCDYMVLKWKEGKY
ncbi:glycosyltransferase family 39 protein [Candidatus Woesearchaeota archaeon]|nr:glycosyltransferase family 39 protein [Candidatus Woesearchaeota archaeon]